jgi:S1-C subfamily serine protease
MKKSRKSSVALFLVLVALIFLMLYLAVRSSDTPAGIYEKAVDKVVELRASRTEGDYVYGTGCFVASDKILTSKHLIGGEPAEDYLIEYRPADQDQFIIIANIESIFPDTDLMILKTELPSQSWFKIAEADTGDQCYSLGNLDGKGLVFSSGIVSGFFNVEYDQMNIGMIASTIIIEKGMSGGALFDKSGRLIGILTLRIRSSEDGSPIYGVSYSVRLSEVELGI